MTEWLTGALVFVASVEFAWIGYLSRERKDLERVNRSLVNRNFELEAEREPKTPGRKVVLP